MRLLVIAVAAIILFAACGDDDAAPSGTATPVPSASPSVTVAFNGGETLLLVEVADDSQERATGLMNRESMPADAGMLFVWPSDVQSGFWMHNTLIPLSIAFIRADGTIVHIEDMEPETDDIHSSPEPYRYAIEVNQGWYAEHGIGVGDTAEIPEAVNVPSPTVGAIKLEFWAQELAASLLIEPGCEEIADVSAIAYIQPNVPEEFRSAVSERARGIALGACSTRSSVTIN